MINSHPIQVFEHDILNIGSDGFKKSHWEALGWYNEIHKGRFFTLTPKGVKFNQYVGVIQVGYLTIEILPKIGKTADEKAKANWQKVLIDMLRECRWMQLYAHDKASLTFKPNSILEAYLELFIKECENLVREGLIKKYRSISGNCTALKGRLIFSKQLQKNIAHQERFFTRHTIFDRENIFNSILLKAIKLIPSISSSPYLKDRVFNLLLSFPEMECGRVNHETFQKLIFDRKTERYREAIEIAAMLLLNYRPDISSGQNHILAILFDMNDLWEEYIYRQLIRYKPIYWIIKRTSTKPFWALNGMSTPKSIIPDILIMDKHNQEKSLIVDTKWKLPDNNIPGDADLKQMFTYNEYWGNKHSVLFYPDPSYAHEPAYYHGSFKQKDHHCGVLRMSVLDKDNCLLDKTIGRRLNEYFERELMQ